MRQGQKDGRNRFLLINRSIAHNRLWPLNGLKLMMMINSIPLSMNNISHIVLKSCLVDRLGFIYEYRMDTGFTVDRWEGMTTFQRITLCTDMAKEAQKLAEMRPPDQAECYLALAEHWLRLAMELSAATDRSSDAGDAPTRAAAVAARERWISS
jgi:hypothetical protein